MQPGDTIILGGGRKGRREERGRKERGRKEREKREKRERREEGGRRYTTNFVQEETGYYLLDRCSFPDTMSSSNEYTEPCVWG